MKELLFNFLQTLGILVDNVQFIEPEGQAGPTEKVLGEMNEMEKALFTELALGTKKCQEFHQNPNITEDDLNEHKLHHKKMDLVQKLLWISIDSRFSFSEESVGSGVRKGFQVVERFEEEGFPGLFGGMMVIEVGRRG